VRKQDVKGIADLADLTAIAADVVENLLLEIRVGGAAELMLMSPNWLMPRKNQVHGLIVWSTLPESGKRKSGKIVG
jgi:hypothetical protein